MRGELLGLNIILIYFCVDEFWGVLSEWICTVKQRSITHPSPLLKREGTKKRLPKFFRQPFSHPILKFLQFQLLYHSLDVLLLLYSTLHIL